MKPSEEIYKQIEAAAESACESIRALFSEIIKLRRQNEITAELVEALRKIPLQSSLEACTIVSRAALQRYEEITKGERS